VIQQEHNYALDSSAISYLAVAPAHHLPFFDNVSSSSQLGHNYHDAVQTVKEDNGETIRQDMVELPWQLLASEGTARENASVGNGRENASVGNGRENASVGTGRDVDEHIVRYDY
jgi:hypothetical protein